MKKRTYKPTLDQVIRDAVVVQERLRRECGAEITFHFTFQPATKPKGTPPSRESAAP